MNKNIRCKTIGGCGDIVNSTRDDLCRYLPFTIAHSPACTATNGIAILFQCALLGYTSMRTQHSKLVFS